MIPVLLRILLGNTDSILLKNTNHAIFLFIFSSWHWDKESGLSVLKKLSVFTVQRSTFNLLVYCMLAAWWNPFQPSWKPVELERRCEWGFGWGRLHGSPLDVKKGELPSSPPGKKQSRGAHIISSLQPDYGPCFHRTISGNVCYVHKYGSCVQLGCFH